MSEETDRLARRVNGTIDGLSGVLTAFFCLLGLAVIVCLVFGVYIAIHCSPEALNC